MYYESTKNSNFIQLVIVLSYEGRLAVLRLYIREGPLWMKRKIKNAKQNGVEDVWNICTQIW